MPDCKLSAKEVCSFMAKPTKSSLEGVYMARHAVDVHADTDHAGCVRTRKSTCGLRVMLGADLLKLWAATLPTMTLSCGEAEMHSMVVVVLQQD